MDDIFPLNCGDYSIDVKGWLGGCNFAFVQQGLVRAIIKGLACGGFSLALRGFWKQFVCLREDINALRSSAQDANVKRCTHPAPSCLCGEVWFKNNFYIAVLSKIVFIDFIIVYLNIFKDGSS